MTTKKNPGLVARTSSVSAALATAPETSGKEKPIGLSVRLAPEMYGKLLDIVTTAKKRGEKGISIHSLILEGLEKVIAEKS